MSGDQESWSKIILEKLEKYHSRKIKVNILIIAFLYIHNKGENDT